MDKKTLEIQIKILANQALTQVKEFSNDIKNAADKAKGFTGDAKGVATSIKTMQAEAQRTANQLKLFGLTSSDLRNTTQNLKKTILDLTDSGLKPESKEVQNLVQKYKELEVEKVIVKADKSELDEELERTRARYARTVKVTDRAAAKDDTVDIDYEGFCDGKAFDGGKAEGHKLKLGSNTFIPGFEDQIIGKNIGESFDVNVTFPKEYHASELAGKEAVFKCKLNGIEFEELPELDDEFAKDASEFDTLDEYKKDIKAKIQQRHDAEAEVRFAEELTKALTDNVKADIPDVLIEKEKDNLLREYDYQLRSQGLSLDVLMKYTGMKLEDIRARYADMALINVKKQLALDEIVKLEKIEATDKEVEDKYGEMAKEFGMKVEDVKSRITAEDLAYDVQSIKAFELVKNSAKVDEKKVTLKEFEEMNSQTKTEKAEKGKKEPAKAKKETAKEPKEQKEPKEPAKEKKTASKAKKEEVKEDKTAKPAKKTTKKAE